MIGTEAPVQEKIVSFLAGIGWRPVDRAEMTKLRAGRMGESLVEPLLVDALRNLNGGLSETEALQVVDQLRRVPDSEEFLRVLRDGLDVLLDLVGLVNGIPLGLIETKAPSHDWKEAARDFRNYWKDAPELEKLAAVCV